MFGRESRAGRTAKVRALVAGVAVPAIVVALAPVTGIASAVTAGPRVAAAATASVPPVNWTACRDGFQCAAVQVPLDYDRPAGAKISLALIRQPAGSPSQRIGSLFMNPGGPGGSGVDLVRGVAQFLPLPLRGRFDIVGFDPRGVARSTPLRCYDTFDEALAGLPPFPYPETPAQEDVQRAADAELAAACAGHGGPILRHMSTADVARDMDLLRVALGDRTLNYFGFSYGSMLGQTYANMFPDKVRALAIDGVLDPIAWTTGRGDQARTQPFAYRLKSHLGANKTLGEFFRLCDAAGPDCALSGNARQRYNRLAERLRAAPAEIVDPGTGEVFPFGYQDLVNETLGAMFAPFSWPDFAAFIADVERQAGPVTLGRELVAVRRGLGLKGSSLRATAAVQEEYPNFVEGGPGVACSDSDNPDHFGAWRRSADLATTESAYFGRIWTWSSSACLPWPQGAGQDRYQGPWTARTAKPVLVVGNYFDPATRYEGAVTASRLLPNSRLLSYAGWGHTAFLSGNLCVDDAVTRYLVTTRTPAPGTVCQPEGSPFGPLAASAAQRRSSAAVLAATRPVAVRRGPAKARD